MAQFYAKGGAVAGAPPAAGVDALAAAAGSAPAALDSSASAARAAYLQAYASGMGWGQQPPGAAATPAAAQYAAQLAQAAQPFQGAYQPGVLGNYQLGSILSASQQALAQLAQLTGPAGAVAGAGAGQVGEAAGGAKAGGAGKAGGAAEAAAAAAAVAAAAAAANAAAPAAPAPGVKKEAGRKKAGRQGPKPLAPGTHAFKAAPGSTLAGAAALFEATARAAGGVAAAAALAKGSNGTIADERELKKQKRKQSNRESARRSRLRKQAECEDLSTRVANLEKLNRSLSEELLQMKAKCKRLTGDNSSLQQQLKGRGAAAPGQGGAEGTGPGKGKENGAAAGVNGTASGFNGVEHAARENGGSQAVAAA